MDIFVFTSNFFFNPKFCTKVDNLLIKRNVSQSIFYEFYYMKEESL